MKILHINCNYIGTALHQIMINHLNKFGIESSVFVPVYDKNHSVIKINNNVKVFECFNKWDRVIFQYKSKKILNTIKKNYYINSFDIIHAYTLFTDGNVAHALYLQYGIPYVVAVRDTDVNSFFKYMIHLRKKGLQIMRDAKAVFFLSEVYRQFVLCKYIPREFKNEILMKSYVIPNGIDDFWLNNKNDKLDKYDYLSNKIKVLFVGQIIKRKNPLVTAKALEILISRGYDVQFTVVGKAKDKIIYDELINFPFVRYYNHKSKEELITIYRENDIFVMPSITETFGLTYAEAMTQGLPVIYTRGQGFDGQFKDGVVGYPIDCKDPNEIADKILAIYSCYGVFSKNCIDLVNKFNWDSICRIYLKIYDKIV